MTCRCGHTYPPPEEHDRLLVCSCSAVMSAASGEWRATGETLSGGPWHAVVLSYPTTLRAILPPMVTTTTPFVVAVD